MIRSGCKRCCMLLACLALGGPAAGQQRAQDPEAPTPAVPVLPEDFDPAVCEEQPPEGESLPPECAELAGQGPRGEVDAGEMRATMRRFVPSEQISEDSSVAFPNDI